MTEKKVAVIGFPVSHSLSPLMHTTWLRKYGIEEGVYEKKEVKPGDLVRMLEESFEDTAWRGFNITIPHKEEALHVCRTLTWRAERMGAVNTLFRGEKGWIGDNTDGWGAVRSLEEAGVDFKGEELRIVVVGAGGAARGITHAFLEEGQKSIVILNRSCEKARSLALSLRESHEGCSVEGYGFDKWHEVIREGDLIVQTTPMGMVGCPDFPFDFEGAKGSCVVMDIVYRPLHTPCLARAREAGLDTVDGFGMLMYQGVPGFEGWFGVKPEVDGSLRRSLLEAIGERD
jgi:shikimate dehydrogenase